MKNKKILFALIIIFFILILNPVNTFAITHITVKDQNGDDVLLSLPDSLDSFKYIVVIDIRKDNSFYYNVYWSNEPFSISSSEGDSYFFYSENGAYCSLYNSSLMESDLIKQHTSYHGENYFKHKVIFSSFNIVDSTGNIIVEAGEYGVDFSNTNNPAEFYEGNSSTTVVDPSINNTIVDTEGTKDSVNNAANEIVNKFNFASVIKNNVSGLIDFLSSIEPCPTLSLDVKSKWYSGQLTVIDLSFYEPYKEAGDLIIVAFAYLMFLWQVFLKLPDIINGIGSSVYSFNSHTEQKINSQLKGVKK